MDPIEELTTRLQEATTKASGIAAKLDNVASQDDLKNVKSEMEATQAEVAKLTAERDALALQAEVKAMRSQLDAVMNTRTERKHQFNINTGAQVDEPFTVKMWKAKNGDMQAKAAIAADLKALAEGTNAGGGYLVVPQYIQELVMLRRASAPLLNVVNTVTGVKSNLVYIPTQTTVETVAWTSENGTKTSTDEAFGQIATNIFTLAGIAKVSNQMLEDSSPAVDQIVKMSLGRGLGIECDRTIINGSGTGQPTGILNTSGITSTAASAQTAASIYDDILAAIGRLQTAYFGMPDTIVMSPRTYTKMLTAKDTAGRYLAQSSLVGNQMLTLGGNTAIPTGSIGGTNTTLFGINLVVDANVPNTLIDATRSVVIVGNFKEAWWLERDGITMDVSAEAGTSFEQNQTWFRGEMRAGFTAARLTSAFQIVTNVGP